MEYLVFFFLISASVAPTILEPPENLTVVHPQSATFLCNATARPRPQITWWRMGSQLMELPGVTEINSYTYGERGSLSTLNITMADPSDAGGYVCMATNVAGRDTSAVELTVHGKCQSDCESKHVSSVHNECLVNRNNLN